jgi:proteasome lid subunit RPN8/RPN11
LRHERPGVRLVSVQPDSPLHGLEGLKHMATAIVPGIYDPGLADENILVSTDDAYALVRRLARESGLLVGPSSGAALAAAIQVARRIERGVVVTIFPDGGDRYLNESFWTAAPERQIVLGADTIAQIRQYAADAYPDECCGALLAASSGEIVEALPLGNSSPEEHRRRFLVNPADYRRAEARADDAGRTLAGFYHSHPDHPAVPSAFDLDHAWPNLSYAIVSVRGGRPVELRSWRLRGDRTAFDEETVITLR